MGFLSKLVGGPAVDIATGVANIVDKFVETDDEKRAAEILKLKMLQKPAELQAEINKIEAGHRTTFVAGARPFILWVCGFGLAFTFLFNPILQWATCIFADACITGPELPHDVMMELVFGILGLGLYRTVEKLNGRAK